MTANNQMMQGEADREHLARLVQGWHEGRIISCLETQAEGASFSDLICWCTPAARDPARRGDPQFRMILRALAGLAKVGILLIEWGRDHRVSCVTRGPRWAERRAT
jgi:hypothetical protein